MNTGSDQAHVLLDTLQLLEDSFRVSKREEQASIVQEVLLELVHVCLHVRSHFHLHVRCSSPVPTTVAVSARPTQETPP